MKARVTAVALAGLLFPTALFALNDLQIGGGFGNNLSPGTAIESAYALAAANIDQIFYRDPENSLSVSVDSAAFADPVNRSSGGHLSLGFGASVLHGLSTYDAGFFGLVSGDSVDGLSALEAGARGGIVTGDLNWSASLTPSITRKFAPLAGWGPSLASRVDLRVGSSLTGSLGVSVEAAGYDSGDASWKLEAGPGFTWYLGSHVVLDVGISVVASRSTLTTALSDLGASGAAASTLVRAGDYTGIDWSAEVAFSLSQRVRAVFSLPGYYRVMGYDHYDQGLLSAPSEWVALLDPQLDATFDLSSGFSLHLVPELTVSYSNSDYRRGTVFSAAAYAQFQF